MVVTIVKFYFTCMEIVSRWACQKRKKKLKTFDNVTKKIISYELIDVRFPLMSKLVMSVLTINDDKLYIYSLHNIFDFKI